MSLRIVRWVALLALDRAALLAELLLALLAELLSTESIGSVCRILFVGLMRPCIAPKTVGVKGALVSGGVCSGSITNRSVTNRSVVTKSGERVFEIFIVAKSIKIFLEPALSCGLLPNE